MKLYHATYAKTLASIQKNELKPNMPHNWGVGLNGYDLSDKIFLSFSPPCLRIICLLLIHTKKMRI